MVLGLPAVSPGPLELLLPHWVPASGTLASRPQSPDRGNPGLSPAQPTQRIPSDPCAWQKARCCCWAFQRPFPLDGTVAPEMTVTPLPAPHWAFCPALRCSSPLLPGTERGTARTTTQIIHPPPAASSSLCLFPRFPSLGWAPGQLDHFVVNLQEYAGFAFSFSSGV